LGVLRGFGLNINLAREKSFTEETLHGNQEEGREEEKETLVEEASLKLARPKKVCSLSREAPLEGLFPSIPRTKCPPEAAFREHPHFRVVPRPRSC
jgi:hypothetical protein